MRKFLLICVTMISFSVTMAQSPVTENSFFRTFYPVSPIKVTMDDNCYIIKWNLPQYDLSYITNPEWNSGYASVSFSEEVEKNPCFKKEFYLGLPELPFFSINLHIPDNAGFDYVIDSIEYDSDIALSMPYLPHQVIGEDFAFNTEYYSTTPDHWDDCCRISSVYEIMGAKGFNIRILPFGYDPQTGRLRPILTFRVRICLTGDESLTEMYENALNNAGYSDAVNFFTTYFGEPQNQFAYGADCSGNFMIITTSDFENDAEIYRQHKENMGYNASLHIVDDYSNMDIIQLLRNADIDPSVRPKYVLIIGYKRRSNEFGVPFSSGQSVEGPSGFIDTDIFYACNNNTPNSESQLLLPKTMVGRWMVKTREELLFIMQKSIDFEFATINRRIAIFSGTDPNGHQVFNEEGIEMERIISIADSSISCEHYSGLNGANRNDIITEFSSNDDFMFIYDGHGNAEEISTPYDARPSHFTGIDKMPYFGLGFACELSMTDSNVGFACRWLNSCSRTCAFYGATCPVTTASYELANDILWGLKNHTNVTIGELVYRGFAQYSLDFAFSIYFGRGYGDDPIYPIWMQEPFILYGDPSLYLYGMSWPGHPAQYINHRPVENNPEYIRRIYSATGVLLLEESGADRNEMNYYEKLPHGILFVVTYDNNGEIISLEKQFN